MEIGKFIFPEELYYDQTHCWVRIEGNVATQGLSDFGQHIAREIAFVELPRLGRKVQQGVQFMSIESGKWVGRLPALLSGETVEVNTEVEWEPERLNQFPYDDGGLVKIRFEDPSELDNLMRPGTDAFSAFIASETEKYADIL